MVYEFYLKIFYNINIKLSKLVMLKCSNKHRNKKNIDGCLSQFTFWLLYSAVSYGVSIF